MGVVPLIYLLIFPNNGFAKYPLCETCYELDC